MVPAPNPPGCDDTKATIFGNTPNPHPVVICFHGSGDSCASWLPLAHSLSGSYRVLLWDRGEPSQKPSVAIDEMVKYLEQVRLQIPPPYVLVAHSYGGTFARTFLENRPRDVAGMVLAETGQETALDAKMEQQQYRRQILGDKPLSVIRANILIRKWAQYEHAVNAADNDTEKTALEVQKQILDVTDKEDERLKKAQLALSRHHRYLHVPDCGHNVIQDRPEVIADEIRWVMENLVSTEKKSANVLRRILSLIGSRRQPRRVSS